MTKAPRLLGGPYAAPTVQPGDWLEDAADGLLQVGGYTAAPIPWPRRRKTGRHSLILCGALVEAVRRESSEAIQHWWGVGAVTVWKWRQILGVDQMTEGTVALYREVMPERLSEEAAARGRERAASPESRAKISATKTGVPVPPQTRAALLKAAKRPKSEAWKAARHKTKRARAVDSGPSE